jgi:hypothetical protein
MWYVLLYDHIVPRALGGHNSTRVPFAGSHHVRPGMRCPQVIASPGLHGCMRPAGSIGSMSLTYVDLFFAHGLFRRPSLTDAGMMPDRRRKTLDYAHSCRAAPTGVSAGNSQTCAGRQRAESGPLRADGLPASDAPLRESLRKRRQSPSGHAECLQVGDDRAKDVSHRTSEDGERGDGEDGNQHQDESVFDETLPEMATNQSHPGNPLTQVTKQSAAVSSRAREMGAPDHAAGKDPSRTWCPPAESIPFEGRIRRPEFGH